MRSVLFAIIVWTVFAVAVFAQTPATNPPVNPTAFSERIRQQCVAGRRIVCGRILKIVPEGLIVESGYPSLRRPSLHGWLIPGTVEAARDPTLVEGREPDALCVGLLLLTDHPKSRRLKPKPFDYVVLEAFPAGNFAYAPAGGPGRPIRRFSAVLENAVKIDRASAAP
jgi:hypothetical protein